MSDVNNFAECKSIKEDRIRKTLNNIPVEAGCYLMKDSEDRLLYVGKSKNLRSRVRSYFTRSNDISPRISLMIRQVDSIEYIITDTESEALTLESNLIKKNQPYFNILLKDDKKYPYMCITWSEDYPRIFITRRRRNRKPRDKFYGPYVDVSLLRKTLFTIKRLFPLRQRPIPLYKDRTCLNYSIERCPGVCQKKISPDEYHKTLKSVEMIFQGRTAELEQCLNKEMTKQAESMKYEKAALIRDQLKGINRLYESQKMIIPDSSVCRDVIALSANDTLCSIQIFQMRSGKLVGRLGYISQIKDKDLSVIEQKIIEEHYSNVDSVEIPSEILLQYKIQQNNLIADWLTEIKGSKVRLSVPMRSHKADLIKLVEKNAKYELDRMQNGYDKTKLELEDLCTLLELKKPPRRIEGYDISHIQGNETVASQVVFIDGVPAKHHYRKYNIKSEEVFSGHSNDFISLKEVIYRRFKRWARIKEETGSLEQVIDTKNSIFDPKISSDWPDLVVIDGGKGQLSSVLKVIEDLNLEEELTVISLAKKKEEVFLPGNKIPLETDLSQPALLLLRRLRNESHRFALTFHRQKRSKKMTRSQLSEIPGIGSKRIKLLLNHFSSIDSIQIASVDQLKATPGLGSKSAYIIWNYFHPS